MSKGDALGEGSSLAELIRAMLIEDEENVPAYIEQSWVSRAMDVLVEARHQAGLTQEQVAERLATTQSAIARLENKREGSLSLLRFVRYLLACDAAPFDIMTEPLHAMRNYIVHNPAAPRTQLDYCVQSLVTTGNAALRGYRVGVTGQAAMPTNSLFANSQGGGSVALGCPGSNTSAMPQERTFNPPQPSTNAFGTIIERRQSDAGYRVPSLESVA